MRITRVKTHIVDTLIPEEHRVRSGAGYKLRRHPYSGEIGIGAGSRPAFGLVSEVIPDRTSTSLA